MKKKLILRGALGVPLGIALGYVITILISLIWADGYYSPCVPELVETLGNEIKAVILQTLLCGLLGAGFAASSVIWEIEHWSIVKQTGIYFLIVSVIMMPIAYFTYWMEHSIAGILSYFGIFVLIFAVIWMVQFVIGKHNVKKMNEKISEEKQDDSFC
ncbi:MAG: DUF3021 domain-containing protein [Faecousia sp.]